MSGLVRYEHEIAPDVRVLECVQCRDRYHAAQAIDLGEPLTCFCGSVGFVPRRVARVTDRFPEEIAGRFTPMPEALMDHAAALGLGGRDLLVVWALERHRRSMGDLVFPSIKRIATLTQQSEATVRRSVRKLVVAGHLQTGRYRWTNSGKLAVNRYSLDPLWQRVAAREAEAAAVRLRPAA